MGCPTGFDADLDSMSADEKSDSEGKSETSSNPSNNATNSATDGSSTLEVRGCRLLRPRGPPLVTLPAVTGAPQSLASPAEALSLGQAIGWSLWLVDTSPV